MNPRSFRDHWLYLRFGHLTSRPTMHGDTSTQLLEQLQDYSRRNISFDSDALNAFLGVLHQWETRLAKTQRPMSHVWGVCQPEEQMVLFIAQAVFTFTSSGVTLAVTLFVGQTSLAGPGQAGAGEKIFLQLQFILQRMSKRTVFSEHAFRYRAMIKRNKIWSSFIGIHWSEHGSHFPIDLAQRVCWLHATYPQSRSWVSNCLQNKRTREPSFICTTLQS